jgi:elongation factor P
MKPATIDTGAKVKVPLFINTGDMIKVDIQKSMYVERVKS